MRASVSTAVIALVIGASGGMLFFLLHMPLPWTLGSLTASAIAAVTRNRWPMPGSVRDLARPVVGVLAGVSFTPEVVRAIPGWWAPIVVVAVYSALLTCLGYFIFTRYFRFDKVTAYFAATPGGLGELSLLGGMLGGSTPTLVLIHSIRVVAIVFGIPIFLQVILGHPIARFPLTTSVADHDLGDWLIVIACGLAGHALGRRFHFPASILVISMLLSAAVHGTGLTDASPPGWLVAFVQVLIGCVAGSRFAGLRWHEFKGAVIVAIGWAAFMLVSGLVVAGMGTWLVPVPFVSLLLALSPGGTTEMIVVAYALSAEVAFVAFCQVSRVILVLTFAPLIFGLLGRRESVQPQTDDHAKDKGP